MSSDPESGALHDRGSERRGRSLRRSSSAWWLTSAAVAAAVAWVAATTGRPTYAWIFAFVAIMSLYGSIDHLAEPAAGELLGSASAAALPLPSGLDSGDVVPLPALSPRQHRTLRFLAYGVPPDEIADLLGLDQATVTSDLERIAVASAAGLLPAAEQQPTRSAA